MVRDTSWCLESCLCRRRRSVCAMQLLLVGSHKFIFRDSLLSQYRFSAAGVGLGTAYALRYKKGFVPMIAAGAIGTTADMVYGFLVECADFRENSNGSK